MSVEIKKVESGKDLKAFMKFPWEVYKDDPVWAPELIMDLKDRLNRKKHPFFMQGAAEFFLAYKDGKLVGGSRLSTIPTITNTGKKKPAFSAFSNVSTTRKSRTPCSTPSRNGTRLAAWIAFAVL
jgi:hypothetical protein